MDFAKGTRAAADSMFEKRREAADKLSAEIAEDRRKRMLADAAKTMRLRDLRLAKEAADARAASETAASKRKASRKHAK